MHYNKDALRGGTTTDQEFIADMVDIFPDMNLPSMLAETSGLVPAVISEMERLNTQGLPTVKNPLTTRNYTNAEAAKEAKDVARASHQDYKQLLDLKRKA